MKAFFALVFGASVLCVLSLRLVAGTVSVSTYPQLKSACQNAEPNDTILVMPGVYTISDASRIMISSRPGPVVVRGTGASPSAVIIEGQGQDNQNVQMVFNLENCPRWTFENLTTRNSYYHGFKFDKASTDCILRTIIMRDHGESGVKGTSDPAAGVYPDRLLIENCDIGFSQPSGGTRSVVEGVDGVGVNDWIIRRSRFVNVQKGGNPAYAIFTKGNSANTIIEACRFENCFIAASFGGGGTGIQFFRDGDSKYEHRNGIIRNNVMIHCSDAGVYINKGSNCKIYNNTLIECELTIQVRFAETSGFVRNNVIVRAPSNPNEPLIRIRDGATLLANEKNLAAMRSDFIQGLAGGDSTMDIHLAPTSAAVNAGVDLHDDVPNDIDGDPRPQSNLFDAGADEIKYPVTAVYQDSPNEILLKCIPDKSSDYLLLQFHLETPEQCSFSVRDILGRAIVSVAEQYYQAGEYTLPLSLRGNSASFLVVQAQIGKTVSIHKVLMP